MHCEFLYREHRKPRWISTPNQKHLFVQHLLDHNLYIEYIFISTAKQWNQEQNSVKHKLGKHQRVRRRKIRRSGGRSACPFSSFVGFNLSRGDAPLNSKVMSRELIEVLCTHSIKLSSLHCLRTSNRSSMGWRWSKCIVLPMVMRSKKKERKERKKDKKKGERKKMNDDEKAPRLL